MCTKFQSKPKGKISLGRTRCKWEENVKIDFEETTYEAVDWIHLSRIRFSARLL